MQKAMSIFWGSPLSQLFDRCGVACRERQPVRKPGALLMLLFFASVLGASPAQAQHEVTGTVTDSTTGNTLPGVNIVVQGTEIGTATSSNGEYTIEAPSPDDTLEVSFVGYEVEEIPIDGRSEIDMALQPAVTAMEEVVVSVGYGRQRAATTTGSVSQISGEDIDAAPTTNLTSALQGRVPGLIGVTSSGRPGYSGSNLLIRGASTLNNNSPLVVINGIPGREGLDGLDPSNIESISVLKDASAAIYGSRAANGVILVETKGGVAGETQFNVNVERNWAQPTVVPEMADAPTYMQMINELNSYQGSSPSFSQEEIEAHQGDLSGSWQRHNTDWYDVALKDFSRELTANASVTGGADRVQYRVSLSGATEEGILVNSNTNFDQIGFRSSIDGDVTEDITLSLNLHGRRESRVTPSWTRGRNAAWEMLQRGKPTDPAFWPNGQPGPAQEQGVNPVVADRTGYDDEDTYYFQSNLSLEAEIPGVEGWTAEGTIAYDRQFTNRKRWQTPWTLYNWGGNRDEEGNPVLIPGQRGVADPHLDQWRDESRDLTLQATSTYETTVGSHNGSLLLGTEWQSSEGSDMYAFRRFFPTDQIDELFVGGTSQQDLSGSSFHSARLNFFGRANYNYQEKYLLELIARYDGSYIFPEGDRFGFFPSVSAGWRLAQEDWFNNWTGEFFDRLKLRSSYGQVGNDRIEAYQYLRTFGFNGQVSYIDGLATRLSQTRVPNPAITWEVATKFDVGLQGAVFGNQLSFDLTYFNQFRDEILWFRSEAVPQTAGFSLPRENIGQVRSWGAEGQVTYTQQIASDLTLRAGANLTWAENRIEYFAEPAGQLPWQQSTGRPMNTGLYYIHDGIWNTQEEIDNAEAHWPGARPGDIRFTDVNGDGQINGDDRQRIEENDRPDLIGGLNLGATLGSFNVQTFWQGATQVRQYVFTAGTGTFGNYFQKFAERRWTTDNTNASGPRSYQRNDSYWASNNNTYFLRDAKYLRLKSARLAYTLPSSLTGELGVERFQVYLSGRNLLTWSPLEIMDPEIRNGSAHTYPPEKAYTVGLQMGF